MTSKSKKRGAWGRAYAYKDKDAPVEKPTPKPPARKKDTRRWCRGRVGRPHVTEIQLVQWYSPPRECEPLGPRDWRYRIFGETVACHEQEVCVNCGKYIRHLTAAECKLNRGTATADK